MATHLIIVRCVLATERSCLDRIVCGEKEEEIWGVSLSAQTTLEQSNTCQRLRSQRESDWQQRWLIHQRIDRCMCVFLWMGMCVCVYMCFNVWLLLYLFVFVCSCAWREPRFILGSAHWWRSLFRVVVHVLKCLLAWKSSTRCVLTFLVGRHITILTSYILRPLHVSCFEVCSTIVCQLMFRFQVGENGSCERG